MDLTPPVMLVFNSIKLSRLGKGNATSWVEGTATFRAVNAVRDPVNDNCIETSRVVKFAYRTAIQRGDWLVKSNIRK